MTRASFSGMSGQTVKISEPSFSPAVSSSVPELAGER
jgi:hypothetical protein